MTPPEMSKAFQHPPTNQAEEQARFAVTQHLNSGGIDHDTLLRMRDSLWSWISILDWINGRPRAATAADAPVAPGGHPTADRCPAWEV
jgi:hypothetical protein